MRRLDFETWERSDEVALARFVNAGPGIDSAVMEQIVARHAKALEHLRLGARRAFGQYPYDWERHNSALARRFGLSPPLLVLAQAKIWIALGRTQDDLLLDLTVYARDLATGAPIWAEQMGMAVYAQTLDLFPSLLQSGKLARAQIEELGRKLEVVARDFPTVGASLAGEALADPVSVLKTHESLPLIVNSHFELKYAADQVGTPAIQWWDLAKQGSWRYWFSDRYMELDAFQRREDYLRRAQALDQMDYTIAKREADALAAQVQASRNPLLRGTAPSFSKVLLGHRESQARLALLRAGVEFLATGQHANAPDPFGDTVRFRRAGDKTVLWRPRG